MVSWAFQVGNASFDQATSLILGHGIVGQHVKRLEYARAIFRRGPTRAFKRLGTRTRR